MPDEVATIMSLPLPSVPTSAHDERPSRFATGRLILTWVPVFVGLATAIVGVVEYTKAQQWKRAEFIATQIEKFEARPGVVLSMLMLDWNERAIPLFPERNSRSMVPVTDSILAGALVPHTERPSFTEVETRIRDNFEQFFDGLERFDHFIQSGLLSDKDIAPYLSYWLEIIGDPGGRKPPELVHGIWRYLGCYRYTGVVSLLRRHGYRVDPTSSCNQKAAATP
jgi:hypothetical protein